MQVSFLYSKIHRATVTDADLDYVGSITIDRDLMNGAQLCAGQRVQIADIDTGARLDTYVIPGEPGSGVIGINGAAARLVHVGDLVIIMCYAQGTVAEAQTWHPAVVHVDAKNRPLRLGTDPAEPPTADYRRPPKSEAAPTQFGASETASAR